MPELPDPKGFLFSTASAAIKKPGRKDIALIYSESPAVCAATFTTNKIKGAPVKVSIEKIKSGKARAIVVNSGNSNVATGAQGMKDAHEMCSLVSRHMGIKEDSVYVSSTGVIGVPLPMDRIRPALMELAGTIGKSSPDEVAQAIMTTDTFYKIFKKKIKVAGKTGIILGIAKGSGMIAPNMATMLSFIMTDIAVERTALKKALKHAVDLSFNRITIDGDMSTSDTAMVMANGLAGNPPVKYGDENFNVFAKALDTVAYELSKMVAVDGEGASKLIEVEVKGAKTEKDALKGALAIANSNLVKTAVYGADVNWGRVICAVGYSGISLLEEKIDIYFGNVKLAEKGVSTGKDELAVDELKKKNVKITVHLNIGKAGAKALTCDLTEGYVKINAVYKT